jgi:hypothetical protein
MEVAAGNAARARSRKGATRATIVLGTASAFSGIGYIVGWFVPFERAQTFPDYAPFAATGGLIGAGLGWALGTAAGISLSAGNRRVGPKGRALLWIIAGSALIADVVIATHEDRLVVTWIITERELAWMRTITVIDSMLVAGTIVLTSFLGPHDEATPVDPPVLRRASSRSLACPQRSS